MGREIKKTSKQILIAVVLGVFIWALILLYANFGLKSLQIEVVGKSDKGTLFVYSKESTFVNKNSMFLDKKNAYYIQKQLKVGHVYIVRTSGFTMPILGWYPNIIEIKSEVHKSEYSYEENRF